MLAAKQVIVLLSLVFTQALRAEDIQPDPVYRETEVRLSRPMVSGEKFDPQESDPALKEKFTIADRQAERAVGNVERDSEFIFHFWKAKKRILRDQFGIQWKTPAELSPDVAYANYGQPKITNSENHTLRALVAPRLSSASEKIQGIDRSFEGVASVWTRDLQTDQMREYQFVGHDESWKFIQVLELEE
jgi:hypothetical protein